MAKVDVVGELQKQKNQRKQFSESNEVVKSVQKLLGDSQQEDTAMLAKLGPKSSLARAQNENGKLLEIENHEKFHSGNIFTRDQILHLATTYRLKFLSTRLYTGDIDAGVIPEIRDMERHIGQQQRKERAERENKTIEEIENINFKFTAWDLENKFFILAPQSCFDLVKESALKPRPVRIVDRDPVMFYQVDDNHYRLIKKWGTDFTIMRRVKGFVFKNEIRARLFCGVLPVTALILSFVFAFANPWLLFIMLINLPIMFAGDFKDGVFGTSWCTSAVKYS